MSLFYWEGWIFQHAGEEVKKKNNRYFYLTLWAELKNESAHYTAWKVSVFGVILVRIFPHSDVTRRDTENTENTDQNNSEYGHFMRAVNLLDLRLQILLMLSTMNNFEFGQKTLVLDQSLTFEWLFIIVVMNLDINLILFDHDARHCVNTKTSPSFLVKWNSIYCTKKEFFPLRISSANVTKPQETADLDTFIEEILLIENFIFCAVIVTLHS